MPTGEQPAIRVGVHPAFGITALTTEERHGPAHDVLTEAGFQEHDFIYTLPPGTDLRSAYRIVSATQLGAAGREIGLDLQVDMHELRRAAFFAPDTPSSTRRAATSRTAPATPAVAAPAGRTGARR